MELCPGKEKKIVFLLNKFYFLTFLQSYKSCCMHLGFLARQKRPLPASAIPNFPGNVKKILNQFMIIVHNSIIEDLFLSMAMLV